MGAESPDIQEPGARPGRVLTALLWGMVLLAFLTGTGAFWRYARSAHARVWDVWLVRLSAMADDRKRAIEDWLEGAQADAQVLLSFPTLRALLAESPPAPGEAPYPEGEGAARHLEEIFVRFARAEGYEGIVLLDPSGRTLIATPGVPDLPEGCRTWMSDPAWKGVGARFFRTPEGRTLVVHARAADPQGTAALPAAIFLVHDASTWLYPLLSREPSATRTGEILVMRREGDLVRFLTPLRFPDAPLRAVTRPYDHPALAARLALEGREAFGEFRDYRDEPILAATRSIRGTAWGLVAKIDREEALAPHRRSLSWIGAVWILLFTLLATAVWVFARRQRLLHLEAVTRRDERYRLLRQAAGDPLLFVRPDGVILEANRAAEETYGYGPGEMAGLSVADILRPEVRADVAHHLQKALEGGIRFETLHVRKDGTAFPVEVASRPAELGGQTLLVSTVRDVTERKRAEEDLRQSEAKYRVTLDAMLEGCQIVGFDWRYLYINRAAEIHNRRPKEDLLGRTVVECWPGIETTRVYELERLCMEERTLQRSEHEFVFPDGHSGWFRLILQPVPEGIAIFSEDTTAAREAQEALRESEERLRSLGDNLPDSYVYLYTREEDGTPRLLYASAGLERIHGITVAEVLGDAGALHGRMDPAQITAFRAAEEESRRAFSDFSMDLRMRRADGQWRWLQVRSRPRRLPDDRIVWDGVATDITAQKAAAETLREERDFSSAVLDSLPGVLYCYDRELRFQRWNRNFESVTGYTAGEVSRLSPLDLFAGSDKDLLARRIGEVFERGEASVEADFLTKDGRKIPYFFTGVSTEIGGRKHLVGVGLDLTALRSAEAETRRLNERLERLIAAVSALAGTRDMESVVTVVRDAARRLAGADGATVVLRDGDQSHYVDEDAIEPLWKGRRFPLSACISGWSMVNRRSVVIQDIYQDPRIPLDAYRPTFVKSLAMVPIGKEDPVGAIGNYWARNHTPDSQELRLLETLAEAAYVTIQGVRAFEDLERRVEERTALLQAANQELEAFSYSVSHDLRAPLRGLDGFSLALAEDFRGKLGPEGEDYIRRIRAAASRMAQLIEDILTLSRVTRAEMRREEVDLSALAETVLQDLRRHGGERAVKVEIEPGLRAAGDSRLLVLVLQNLLGNAWKFTAKRERASIRFRREGAGFVVEDDGAGFDPRYTDKLFAPFQRLHTASEFPGTGVGLAIVQRIVRRHGGRVWAEGEVDKGARFGFTLSPGLPK